MTSHGRCKCGEITPYYDSSRRDWICEKCLTPQAPARAALESPKPWAKNRHERRVAQKATRRKGL